MLVEEEFTRGHVILRLNGELDLDSADEFRRRAEDALERHGSRRLIVNMRKVSFIDSSGLGAILGRYRRLAQREGWMAIVAPQGHVRTVLEFAGIRRVIPIYGSEDRALAEGSAGSA